MKLTQAGEQLLKEYIADISAMLPKSSGAESEVGSKKPLFHRQCEAAIWIARFLLDHLPLAYVSTFFAAENRARLAALRDNEVLRECERQYTILSGKPGAWGIAITSEESLALAERTVTLIERLSSKDEKYLKNSSLQKVFSGAMGPEVIAKMFASVIQQMKSNIYFWRVNLSSENPEQAEYLLNAFYLTHLSEFLSQVWITSTYKEKETRIAIMTNGLAERFALSRYRIDSAMLDSIKPLMQAFEENRDPVFLYKFAIASFKDFLERTRHLPLIQDIGRDILVILEIDFALKQEEGNPQSQLFRELYQHKEILGRKLAQLPCYGVKLRYFRESGKEYFDFADFIASGYGDKFFSSALINPINADPIILESYLGTIFSHNHDKKNHLQTKMIDFVIHLEDKIKEYEKKKKNKKSAHLKSLVLKLKKIIDGLPDVKDQGGVFQKIIREIHFAIDRHNLEGKPYSRTMDILYESLAEILNIYNAHTVEMHEYYDTVEIHSFIDKAIRKLTEENQEMTRLQSAMAELEETPQAASVQADAEEKEAEGKSQECAEKVADMEKREAMQKRLAFLQEQAPERARRIDALEVLKVKLTPQSVMGMGEMRHSRLSDRSASAASSAFSFLSSASSASSALPSSSASSSSSYGMNRH